ncbi:MAG: ABC transporter ATP-binding protein [candidate division KSB1 bacterium]|nr:ABC transporter ATP-binding protein [candidate division KSB1 bacterium]MDQ7062726.1 ABC transporter ATP-binding protein [candidate division KSB1 bacterium]
MIRVENLTRYYGNFPAIEDVTFDVDKGEILGFLGPNGAGKSTTMRILTCYMPATSGKATVAGFDVFEQSMEVRKRIGYLPEHPPLYPDLTVDTYLDFVAKIKGVPAQERKKAIDDVIDRVGLQDVRNRTIRKLSKGFKQRVGLAQALVHDPEVLILDEPTVGLDPKQIIEVRELIKSLAGRHTVILSTHILPEVSMTCQRVVIIDKGRVVAEDTPENLSAKVKSTERILVEVEGPQDEVKQKLTSVPGVKNVSLENANGTARFVIDSELDKDIRKDLANTVVSQGWGLLELRPMDVSLEEVFLRLTTKE